MMTTNNRLKLRGTPTMELSITERAQVQELVVDEIVSKYEPGTTVKVIDVVENLEGYYSRSASEVFQAIDFGEAQGRLSVDLNNRTLTIN